ncbi:MAG: hypothetical protein NVV74_18050 [Magnetospirillum sp.]|nr:hypothetical protein [Magnetospirillum sp.]
MADLAVRQRDLVVEGEGGAGGQRMIGAGQVIRGDEVADVAAAQVLALLAGHALERRVGLADLAGGGGDDDALQRRREGHAEAFLAVANRLLGLDALLHLVGDVQDQAVPDDALAPSARARLAGQPMGAAVGADDAHVLVHRFQRLRRDQQLLQQKFAVGVDHGVEQDGGVEDDVAGVAAHDFLDPVRDVGIGEGAVGVEHALEHHAGQVGGDGAQAPFGLLQHQFGGLAPGDVAADDDQRQAAVRANLGHRHLERKERAVLAPGHDLLGAARKAAGDVGDAALRDVLGCVRAAGRRHQVRHATAQHLVQRPAEQAFGGAIGPVDAGLCVQGQDHVLGMVHDGLELVLRPHPRGDIDPHAVPQDGAVVQPRRRRRTAEPFRLTLGGDRAEGFQAAAHGEGRAQDAGHMGVAVGPVQRVQGALAGHRHVLGPITEDVDHVGGQPGIADLARRQQFAPEHNAGQVGHHLGQPVRDRRLRDGDGSVGGRRLGHAEQGLARWKNGLA